MEVRVWQEQQWWDSHAKYSQLLANSSADPLFHSWDWQYLWWKHLPRDGGEKLTAHAAFDGDTLVGVLAVVSGTVLRRGGLRYRSAQVLGKRILDSRGALNEYADVVALEGREQEVRKACLQSVMERERCSEVAIAWTKAGDEWRAAIDTHSGAWTYTRTVHSVKSYQADLSLGFKQYLAGLSSNARRSLFNLRRKLSGTVVEVPASDYKRALTEMNRLHSLRWGTLALDGIALDMHEALIERWSDQNRIRLSQIEIDGRCVSVLYDIRVETTQYNIQMGFDPGLDQSLSLGLLHLGYAMEQAAADGVRTYDFLGGAGRTTDYKRRIATHSVDVVSLQCVTNPILATVFRAYDSLARHGPVQKGVRSLLGALRFNSARSGAPA